MYSSKPLIVLLFTEHLLVDSFRNQLAMPSEELMGTFAAMQDWTYERYS